MAGKARILSGSRALRRKLNKLPEETKAEVVEAIGASLLLVQNDARRSIQKGPKSGRIYKRGGVTHQASAPGQAPATDSGRLVSHINHEQDGMEGTVGVHELSQVKYARRLEAERPFLFPAYERNRKKIAQRIAKILPAAVRKAFRGR